MNNLATEYERDFHAWIQQHITLFKQGKFDEIDVEHLILELEDMAGRDRDELVSRLIILIAYLLKWQFQLRQLSERWQEFNGRSWRGTIIEQRNEISRQLKKKPSLKSYIQEALIEAYPDAVTLAVDETKLSQSTFPSECPYTIEQLLDKTFYPESKD